MGHKLTSIHFCPVIPVFSVTLFSTTHYQSTPTQIHFKYFFCAAYCLKFPLESMLQKTCFGSITAQLSNMNNSTLKPHFLQENNYTFKNALLTTQT